MGKSEALSILSDIQAATFKNAAQLPLKESAQPEWQGIGYQIGGIRLVSPMGEVAEILKVPKITALPGVKGWILGIANVRGRLMPIVDLHEYLNMAESPHGRPFGLIALTTTTTVPMATKATATFPAFLRNLAKKLSFCCR